MTKAQAALRHVENALSAARRWLGLQRSSAGSVWSQDARSLLRRPGCPVCESILESLHRQYFWFFEEQYHHPSTMREMQDSLGFCRAHARDMLEIAPPYRIGYLHLVMVHETLGRLRRLHRAARAGGPATGGARGGTSEVAAATRAFERTAPCFFCNQEGGTADLASHLLVYAMHDPEILSEIESFGKLCTPHFMTATEAASGEFLRLLLPVKLKALHSALREAPSLAGGQLTSALLLLERAMGADVMNQRGSALAPGRMELEAGPAQTDPIPTPARMVRLLREPRCPICTLAQEALAIYLAWYRDGVSQWIATSRRRGDGLGPLCRDHTWMVAGEADPDTLLSLARYLADEDTAHFGRAEAVLTAPDPLPPWRTNIPRRLWPRATKSWLRKMYRREARRLANTKWTICEVPECPACRHLATITHRSLDLLFAVLQDPAERARYRDAWGLCMQHFADGLALPVEAEVLETVVAVQIARLATLEWELEEYYRKASWNVRYEPKGPEGSAWARAIERFSGTGPRPVTPPSSQSDSVASAGGAQ